MLVPAALTACAWWPSLTLTLTLAWTSEVVIALVAAALEAAAARLRVLLRLEAPVLLPRLVAPAALRLLELLPLLRRARMLLHVSHCARRHVTSTVLVWLQQVVHCASIMSHKWWSSGQLCEVAV